MTQKTNLGLVAWVQKMLGQPYWWGTCCYPATASLLASKTKQYPDSYKASRTARYKADIAKGATVADCVGLIKGYYWARDDGKIIYGLDGRPDKGANSMFSAAKVKGPISALPETPGLLLYSPGHVGVYIGGGWAIEARGFDYGVVKTRVRDRKWTHFYRCPYIEYVEANGHDDGQTGETVAPPQPQDPANQPHQGATPDYGTRLLRYKPGRKAQSGADVTAVQIRLSQLGHSPGKVDGLFGPLTAAAVKGFQEAASIEADGIVGPVTRGALGR